MAKYDLDKDQKRAVECDKNVVVSAGAGSGKTTVLSKRYVRLIKEGRATVDSILTLTFTRKAATEMYERIYKELVQCKDNSIALEQGAKFDTARISTLDSFSADIVRNGSSQYGIPGDFITDTDMIEHEAEETALDFLLRHQDNEALKQFILIHGFESVYKDFFVPIAINNFNIAEPLDLENSLRNQERELRRVCGKGVAKIEALRLKIASQSLSGNGKVLIQNQNICIKSGPFIAGDLKDKSSLINLKENISSFSIKKSRGKSDDDIIQKEYIEEIKDTKKEVLSVLGALNQFPLIKGVFKIIGEFQEEFLKKKRSKGILTFSDVAALAVKILENDYDLRRFYKEKFSHIMIDEFQDNNMLQKKLLFLLAEKKGRESSGIPSAADLEPGKLFFVGDEKQSIYSFRGADVSVFKKLRKEIVDTGGEFLSLDTNYRSEPGLIDFFNSFFPEVMKNPEKGYEAEFTTLKTRDKSRGIVPCIKFFYKQYTEKSSAEGESLLNGREAEAYHIAKYIKDVVETKKLDIPLGNGNTRYVSYSDIALLMKSTGDQILYEKYFRLLNIPYTVQSVRALFLESPINDMFNFLKIVAYPEDSAAYLGVLRSPFVNMNDDASTRLILEDSEAFKFDPSSNPAIIKRKEDLEKYIGAAEIYKYLSSLCDRVPKTELIKTLWFEGGYRYYLLNNPLYEGYLEYYDYLQELAFRSDQGGENLASFLDFIGSNLGKYERIPDLELLRDRTEGVNFMTVHKSKGLEFPVVIVADTGNSGSGGDNKKPYYISEKFGLSLKIGQENGGKDNYFYSIAKEENQNKLVAEAKRILYVAMTRAKTHLVISGTHGRNNRNTDSATGRRTLLNFIYGAFTDREKYIEHIPDYPVKNLNLVQSAFKVDFKEIKKAYSEAKILVPGMGTPRYTVTELNRLYAGGRSVQKGERLPSLDSDSIIEKYNLQKSFGTLCHLIIERRLTGKKVPEGLPRDFIQCSPREMDVIMSDAETLGNKFLNSSFFKKAGIVKSMESEAAFLYMSEVEGVPAYLSGQFDLILERENDVLVVDFKSDLIKDTEEYELQMKIYREAASRLYSKDVEVYLFYLREGRETIC